MSIYIILIAVIILLRVSYVLIGLNSYCMLAASTAAAMFLLGATGWITDRSPAAFGIVISIAVVFQCRKLPEYGETQYSRGAAAAAAAAAKQVSCSVAAARGTWHADSISLGRGAGVQSQSKSC